MREEAAGGVEGFSEVLRPNAPGKETGSGIGHVVCFQFHAFFFSFKKINLFF